MAEDTREAGLVKSSGMAPHKWTREIATETAINYRAVRVLGKIGDCAY